MRKFYFFFIFILSGCTPLPSGYLTIVKGQLINKSTQAPMPEQLIHLKECNLTIFTAPPECDFIIDTIRTGVDGKFEYAFFHDQGHRYLLELEDPNNRYCFEEFSITVGDLVEKVFEVGCD